MGRGIIDFFNPSGNECPRVIVCHYFGDMMTRPSPPLCCCDKCNPGMLDTHLQRVNIYQPAPPYRQPKQKRRIMNTPGKSFPEMTKELKDKVYLELLDWRHWTWRSQPFSFDEPSYISPETIIMNSDLIHLASNLHKALSCKRFDILVQSWYSVEPLSSEELANLWKEVQELNDRFGKEMKELTKQKKSKGKKLIGNKRERDEEDKPGSSMGIRIDEVIVTPTTGNGNVVVECGGCDMLLEVEGPRKRIRTERGAYEDGQKRLAELKKESRKNTQ